MSLLAKKTKTPRKTQETTTYWNQKNMKYQISKCQIKEAHVLRFLHLACQWGQVFTF